MKKGEELYGKYFSFYWCIPRPNFEYYIFLNLVTIIKKVKKDEQTTVNTIWLTTSFVLITWSIAIMAFVGV